MSVPKLRFKDEDGREFPSWEVKTLGKIVTIVSGISPSRYSLSKSGIYPFLKVEDLNNCIKYQIASREYSSSTKNLVPKNSIIFPKRGAAILNNKVRISPIPVLMDSNLMALIPINNEVNFEYLYYKIFKDQLFRIADTSSIPQINNKHILPYLISLPGSIEQTKIANFLTAIDEKITQLTQKYDLLKQYKKGVMQQIFSQKLRFKGDDGREFPEWEEKEIGDIFKFKQGIQCAVEKQFDKKNEAMTRFIRIIDLTNKNEPERYIPNPGSEHLLQADDIFMVRYGSPGLIGYGYAGVIANNLFRLIAINKELTKSKFYYYVFLFRNKDIVNLSNSSTMPAINFSSLGMLKIPRPSIQEQTKIANFLTAIDDKITHTKTQLDAVKLYKKGLLQQMFV